MAAIIECQGLTKRFGNLIAVDNLSLKVEKGEVFGLLGPNGAGKTTTIKMMVGLLKPTLGEVYIGGKRVKVGSSIVKEKVGVVPQEIVLWPLLTVWENLMLMAKMYDVPKDEAKTRAKELLESLELWDRRSTLSKNLSGGMKRRLNLAMGLMHDPEIVLLDEPSPGLDPQTRLLLWNFISEIPKKGKKTVILTTHFMEEADRLSTRVGIMDHGKLLVLDTPENLKRQLGKGDSADFILSAKVPKKLVNSIRDFKGVLDVKAKGTNLTIRAYDMMSIIPSVFRNIDSFGLRVVNITMVPTTLEDVFIHLTGRSLREDLYS